MKKLLLILLIIIVSLNCYGQISFEKGYYITNSNEKIDCLIKNIDWKNNPTEFKYKLSENTEPKTATIKSVSAFGIYDISEYNRYTVKIDRSSNDLNKLSTDKNPIFKEEQLFLKVLVQGKANLFLFEDGNLRRFFYKTNTTDVEQLIFKNYRASKDKIGKNNRFRQQLWNNLKCQNKPIKSIEQIDYKKNELVALFVKYNKCNDSNLINFEEKQRKYLFNLTLRPGLNSTNLSIQNAVITTVDVDFGNELELRFGLEAEFIFPFNKNKWAIIIEPTYQHFTSEKQLTTQTVKVDYASIEIPMGIRHYMFLNKNSKLFVNASFVFDLSSNPTIDFERSVDLDIKSNNNLAVGFGYKHANTYSVELRYGTDREILSDYIHWNSNYQTISLIVGYSLF